MHEVSRVRRGLYLNVWIGQGIWDTPYVEVERLILIYVDLAKNTVEDGRVTSGCELLEHCRG